MRWNNNTGLIGVDIGTHAVKLAQVERRANRFTLRAAAVILRRDPWNADNWLSAAPRSSAEEIISGRLLGGDFAGRQAACVLPMAVCDVRGMQIQAGDAAEQRASIEGELRSVWGNGNQFIFDSWSVPPMGASIPHDVNVLSTSLNWSDRLALDHRQSKLTCRVMDGLPLALSRAIRLTADGPAKSLVAALDWGFERATFCLIRDGQPVFVRCFRDAGFQKVIDAICRSLAVTVAEAHQILSKHGLPESPSSDNEVQQLIADVVADAIDGLSAELIRTLTFLRPNLRNELPSRLWLFGGGTSIKRIDQVLTERVELPVGIWQPQLNSVADSLGAHCPLSLLGPAIALSMLAWEKR